MHIQTITGKNLHIKLSNPFSYCMMTLHELPYVLIKVETDEGLLGIGEAALAWDVTGETQGGALEIVTVIEKMIHNEKVESLDDVRRIMERIDTFIFNNTGLKAAVESALLDVVGQYLQQPIYALVGGKKKDAVILSKTLSYEELNGENTSAIIRHAIAGGVDLFKLKVGRKEDIGIIKNIVRRFPHIKLVADVNKGWYTVQEAHQKIKELEHLNIAWVEQPLPADDLNGLVTLRKHSPIPVMADESCHTLRDLQHLYNRKAIDLINIKLAKCGGLLNAKEMIRFCERNNIKYMLGDMLHSSIGTAYNLHATTLGDFVSYDLTLPSRIADDPGEELHFDEYKAFIPHEAGLGVRLKSNHH